MITVTTITPQEYKRLSKANAIPEIKYGEATTPFGKVIIATTEDKICALEFTDNNSEEVLESIMTNWPHSQFTADNESAEKIIENLFNPSVEETVSLLLKGTPFQIKVWKALLAIPKGTTLSYSQLAENLEMQSATRAVASAVAKNPIGYIVPCHRIIRKGGDIGQYHWGSKRKEDVIRWESKDRS